MIDVGRVWPLQRIGVEHPFDETLEVLAHVPNERRLDERERVRIAFEYESDWQTFVAVADFDARQRMSGAGSMSARKHPEIARRATTTLWGEKRRGKDD